MIEKWQEIVRSFPTIPYLFIGSGITRRYLNLPDWENLLRCFTERVSQDKFKYESYKSITSDKKEKIGEILEVEFNKKWFDDESFRTAAPEIDEFVKAGASPFKAEVSYFIQQQSQINREFEEEIETLKFLTKQNISGFITTNYDDFLETIAPDYKVYVGQEELIFSQIQEMAEIFKIHGSISDPNTIVINEKDYRDFAEKSAYLAAKLMTIFIEYPIIFIGYSISDTNIRKILESIVNCLSEKNIFKLANRFIFVQRNSNYNDTLKISDHTMDFGGKIIPMTKIETNNFQLIFEVLKEKRAGLPVKTLRFLKEQFYNYTISNIPSKHVVVNPYDPEIPEENIGFFIGQNCNEVLNGLVGIKTDQWYKNILFENTLPYSADALLKYAFPVLFKQNNSLPVFKYLFQADEDHSNVLEQIGIKNFDDLISSSFKKNREIKIFPDRSVRGLIKQYSLRDDFDKNLLMYLAYLKEDEIIVEDLEDFLKKYFALHPDILSKEFDQSIKTNIRRLIRIYDWLKYHK